MMRLMIPTLVCATTLALVQHAKAMPSSYAQAHRAWCTANQDKEEFARNVCVDRRWCNAHWNDDRVTRITCDPYRSKADEQLPSPKISVAGLDAGRDLKDAERLSECLGPSSSNPFGEGCQLMSASYPQKLIEERNGSLSPSEMKSVKLAVRAHIALGPFPITVIKIGVGSAGRGTMSVTANVNGNRPRQTRVFRLPPDEIDHLIAALNSSQFWRLPAEPRHQGPADGEMATVEVSIPGSKHHVTDFIGDSDAVDLSVLVNALSVIVASHWRGVPGT